VTSILDYKLQNYINKQYSGEVMHDQTPKYNNYYRGSSAVMVISLVEDNSFLLDEECASCDPFSVKKPSSLG
jgi:hypothetical protein